MSKNLRKIIALSVASFVLALILGGCVNNPEVSRTVGDGKYASDKPLELSIHLHYNNTVIFDNEWEIFKAAAKKTNINLKGTASKSATDSNQVFNIMMASKELPDIIHTDKLKAIRYGAEGAMIPLNDLIENHAPNIKKLFENNPEVQKHLTAPDGNIYFISFIADGETASGYFMRQDWLDKLGLDMPKTTEEYYNVLKAFKNNDPNGNGINDEIPLFFRNKPEVRRIVNLFGARTGWYIDNGKVKLGEYTPEYKEAITNVAKWYAEGIIDQEVFTRSGTIREEILGKDLGGSTRDWFGSTAEFNTVLQDRIPGFKFIAIPPPADKNGNAIEETYRKTLSEKGWCISYNNKYPVETIKYFDFWFSEEGRRLMNYGIEGVHYDMVDGEPIIKQEILDSNITALTHVRKDGAQVEIGFHQDFGFERQWMNESAKVGIDLYLNNNYIVDQFPSLAFVDEEQRIIQQKWTAIDTYIEETNQKWILGAENPMNTFDEYINRLRAMGIDEVIEVYQKAFDRYNSIGI